MLKKIVIITLVAMVVFAAGVCVGTQTHTQDQQHTQEEAFVYNTDEAIAQEILHYDVVCVVDSEGYEYAVSIDITDVYTIDDTHTTVQQIIDEYVVE